MAKEQAAEQQQKVGVPKIVVVLVALVTFLLGVGGTLALFVTGIVPVAGLQQGLIAEVQEQDKPLPPPVYLPLDPAFVVNVDRNGRRSFLQITVQVMTREPKVEEVIARHNPVIRNNLLQLFGSKTYAEIETRQGRDALRAEALKEINKVLIAQDAPGLIEELYFTGFVMQ